MCFSFPKYTGFRSNRKIKRNGGVALLSKSYLNPTRTRWKVIEHLELVGTTLAIPGRGLIDAISVYCPKGDATIAYLEAIVNTSNEFIIAGDLNAHHETWENTKKSNRCGIGLHNLILSNTGVNLVTPHDLGARINPRSGRKATIDLMVTSNRLKKDAELKTGSFVDSDHLPVIATLNNMVTVPGWRNGTPW